VFANSQSFTGEQAIEFFFLNGFFVGFCERKSMLIEFGPPDFFWNGRCGVCTGVLV
jgi:hypothetical protein